MFSSEGITVVALSEFYVLVLVGRSFDEILVGLSEDILARVSGDVSRQIPKVIFEKITGVIIRGFFTGFSGGLQEAFA